MSKRRKDKKKSKNKNKQPQIVVYKTPEINQQSPAPADEPAATPPPPSPQKVAANRDNAQHSTGPKSTEGKERSSRNAAKHYLTSSLLVTPTESQEEYDAFQEAMLLELAPVGFHELELALRYINTAWRLRRVPRYEVEIHNTTTDDSAERLRQLNLALRYERDMRRNMERDLAALNHLRRNRNFDAIERERLERIEKAHGAPVNLRDLHEWAYRVARHTMTLDQMLKFMNQPVRAEHLGFVSEGSPFEDVA